ncbi:hypothetical protein FRC08_016007 [Ceratobasidium sp. 394]|nr:hypothetical protein FRC08_016007 [Ceratobasidium sp. 394]
MDQLRDELLHRLGRPPTPLMYRPPYGPQIVGKVPAGGVVIPPIPDRGVSRQSGRSQIVVPPALSDSNVPYAVHSTSEESITSSETERSFQIPPVYGQPPQSGPVIPSHISTTDESTFESTTSTDEDFEVPVIPPVIPHDAIPPAFEASRPPSGISQESIVIPPLGSPSGVPGAPFGIAPQQPVIVVPPPAQPPQSQTPSVVFAPAPAPAPAPVAPVSVPVSPPVSLPAPAPAPLPSPEVEVVVVAPTPEESGSELSAPQIVEVIAPSTESVTDAAPQVIRVSSPVGSPPSVAQVIRVGSPAGAGPAQIIRVAPPAASEAQVIRVSSPATTQPQVIRLGAPATGQATPQIIRVTSPATAQPQIIRVASPPHVVRVGSPTSSYGGVPQVIRVTSPRTALGPQIIRVGSTRPRVRRDSHGSDYVAVERPHHRRSPSGTTRVASPPTVVEQESRWTEQKKQHKAARGFPARPNQRYQCWGKPRFPDHLFVFVFVFVLVEIEFNHSLTPFALAFSNADPCRWATV